MSATSTKPYLLRALHEWATDNGYTPHIVVQVDHMCRVPMAFVRDDQITLNISEVATGGLTIGNEYIEFQGRFGGKPEHVFVPVGAVSAIYARETGSGMGFEIEASATDAEVPVKPSEQDKSSKRNSGLSEDKPARPSLKIVK